MGKSFGIISLKGGVGKTSVVSSLGAAISNFDKKVLLVDGNFSSPNLGLHLNIVDPEITLHHVLSREADVKQAIFELENFDIIPSSIFSNLDINPFKLKDKVNSLRKNYDAILIDSSPSLQDETLAVMLASDEIIIVTTPDCPTLSTTMKAVKKAKQRGTPITGIVLNKVYNKKFEIPIEEIERFTDVPVMAIIPYDVNHVKALSKFTPSTIYKPKSQSAEEYRKLASVLIGEKYNPLKFKNLFKFSPKRQDINREIYYESIFK